MPATSPSRTNPRSDQPVRITPRHLRSWPLPEPDQDGDKEERGRVLIVGGSPEMPGPAILAAEAALRAGAGKLRIAAGRSMAPWIAAAVPEARVFAQPESRFGGISPGAAEAIGALAAAVDAVVIGPGLVDDEALAQLVPDVISRAAASATPPAFVLDAGALSALPGAGQPLRALAGRAVLTPHIGEMAAILGVPKETLGTDRPGIARRAAADLGAVAALKGRVTVIAAPDGRAFENHAGNVGLATSGSGDTLAGLIGGLLARGAEPLQAAVWSVYLHAVAGDRLARRIGPLGYLARELLAEVPRVMASLKREE
jgi:ADP-dependent NAD(P)H-hydrate dehydratase